MSEIKVQFFGICTHMEPARNIIGSVPPADSGRRVVLVNASSQERIDSFPELKRHQIKPHVALLQIAKGDLVGGPPAKPWFPIVDQPGESVIWELKGVSMTIRNSMPAIADERGLCVPHLSNFVPGRLPAAGPPTYDGVPEQAACYFDFPHSAYYGRTIQGGAVVGVLNVHVSGEPVIDVASFTGERTVSIPVRPGAQISLSNIPLDAEADKDADFLLHFMLSETFPEGARFPTHTFQCGELDTYNLPTGLPRLTGPGCSNSNYP